MVTKQDMNEIYKFYIENKDKNKQKTENEVIRRLHDYINLIISQSTIYTLFLPEFKKDLIVNIFRAFNCYDSTRGVQLYGWVTRIAKQTAYNFIKDKCNKNQHYVEYNTSLLTEEYEDTDEYRTYLQLEDDEILPDERIIAQESQQLAAEALTYMINKILKRPLEIEVYCRRNGILDFSYSQSFDEISREMNLTPKTVERINDNNNSKMNNFKKWLAREEYDSYESWIVDEYIKYLNDNKIKK